jgi:hypothetical protein
VALGLAACRGATEPRGRQIDCTGEPVTSLTPGGFALLDPAATGGCLRLPAAAAGGAEHLVVVLSANGQETPGGVHGSFSLAGGAENPAAAVSPSPVPSAFQHREGAPVDFHAELRARERRLAMGPSLALSLRGGRGISSPPPVVGDSRDFQVCGSVACTGYVTVRATARYVGANSAVFVDDTVPSGGFTSQDITTIGELFDQQLYPIDTTAFGRESDLDGNGLVIALLTDQINRLSPDCDATGQAVSGYFLGTDLDLSDPNSNRGEVFYSRVPDPAHPLCFSKDIVLQFLAPTFIHEFQHMISFNRHVLLPCAVQGRCGSPPEETWLNEGLSHFAEELGGRRVAPGSCSGSNCLNQFVAADIRDAAAYLDDPEGAYLVEPAESGGTLAERGANWLFIRWLADRSPGDPLLGTDVTRRLLGAEQPGGITLTGAATVIAAAQLFQPGATLPELLGQWHAANYVEHLPRFNDPSGRLSYTSWDLQSAIDQLVPGPYPLRPDSTSGAGYTASGTLRGGSGKYLRIVQVAGQQGVALDLTTGNAAPVMPRLAVVRIR